MLSSWTPTVCKLIQGSFEKFWAIFCVFDILVYGPVGPIGPNFARSTASESAVPESGLLSAVWDMDRIPVLGGSWGLVTIYIWAYNQTYSLRNWPYKA